MNADEWARAMAEDPGNPCIEAALIRARVREGLEPAKVNLGARRFVARFAKRLHLVRSATSETEPYDLVWISYCINPMLQFPAGDERVELLELDLGLMLSLCVHCRIVDSFRLSSPLYPSIYAT